MRHNTLGDLFGILFILAIVADIFGPIFELLIPLALIGVMGFVVYKAIQSSNNKESTRTRRTTTRSYGYTERKTGTSKTSSDLAKINVYLRKYFKSNSEIEIPEKNIILKLRTQRYTSLTSLDVYHVNGARLGTLTEYRNQYGTEYDELFDILLDMASNSYAPKEQTIVEAEIVEETPKKKEETVTKEEPKEKSKSQYYIDKINDLNDDIPHEEISNGLYETCALLKQIQTLENKFPDSKDKMNKMYEHYLPYLVQILETYAVLQTVKSDPNYEKSADQLTRTVDSINEALKNIIPTMSDSDFTNLSVDMATLEALLQKDGLTGGMESAEASKEK